MHISLLIPKSSAYTTANKTGSWSYMRPRYLEKDGPLLGSLPLRTGYPPHRNAGVARAPGGGRGEPYSPKTLCPEPAAASASIPAKKRATAGNSTRRFRSTRWSASSTTRRATNRSPKTIRKRPPKGKRVAIVGSGPAGFVRRLFPRAAGIRMRDLRSRRRARRRAARRHSLI